MIDATIQRTYGGTGRHTIPGHGVRVKGSPDDVRKVIRRHSAVPLTFDTLEINPEYVGRHRAPYSGRHRSDSGTVRYVAKCNTVIRVNR